MAYFHHCICTCKMWPRSEWECIGGSTFDNHSSKHKFSCKESKSFFVESRALTFLMGIQVTFLYKCHYFDIWIHVFQYISHIVSLPINEFECKKIYISSAISEQSRLISNQKSHNSLLLKNKSVINWDSYKITCFLCSK